MKSQKQIGWGCLALGIALMLALSVGLVVCPMPSPGGTGAAGYMPYEDHGIVCNLLVHAWISALWAAVICATMAVGLVLVIFWW
jgi:hypothetical protein